MSETIRMGPFYHPGGKLTIWYHRNEGQQIESWNAGWYFRCHNRTDEVICHPKFVKAHTGYPTTLEPFADKAEAQKAYERRKEIVHWQVIYHKALANMPAKIQKVKCLVRHAKGTIPLPDYVVGHAKGTMRIDERGYVQEETIIDREYGQKALLGRLLGKRGLAVHSAAMAGNRPKSDTQRALLEMLAGPEGNAYAWQKLREWKTDKYYKK